MWFYHTLFYLFIVIGAFYTIHMGLYILAANIQDIRNFKKSARSRIKKPKTIRPLVSIIIPAYNEALGIEACLDSIVTNTYKRVEVIVHNDNSSDATSHIVTQYKKRHPHFNLRIVNRRTQVGKAHGVNYCAKKYATGKLIMTLDADCLLAKDTIKNAVQYFVDPTIVGVAANVRVVGKDTVLGLLQKFEHMIGYRSKHFYSLSNCEFIVGGVASTYRRETLQAVKYYDTDTQTEDIGLSMKIVAEGNTNERIIYADDVIAMTGGVQTLKALIKQRYRWKLGMLQNLMKYRYLAWNRDPKYSRSLTMYRVPLAFLSEVLLLLEPFILLYLVYISILFQTLVLFGGAYVTLTLYVLWTVWPDRHLTNSQKARLSLYAPIMYFIFYIMNLVQITAIVQVLIKPKVLLGKKQTGSQWTPPERIVLKGTT